MGRHGSILAPLRVLVYGSDQLEIGEVRVIVVVGASAGGVEALSDVLLDLPLNIPIAIFVALHLVPNVQSHLPAILARRSRLPAKHATQHERFKPGNIYIAPPGFHLLVGKGILRLRHGPTGQHPQPAIDPMFSSVAQNYGHRAVGILLSGLLNDGVAGLKEIKRHGGLAFVQDPAEAQFPELPRNALAAVNVDACLPAAKIRDLLTQLPSLFAHAR